MAKETPPHDKLHSWRQGNLLGQSLGDGDEVIKIRKHFSILIFVASAYRWPYVTAVTSLA